MIDSTNPRVMADNIKELSVGQFAQGAALEAEIEALGSYSETETDTGKKWGDKSIYRKTFIVESMPNNGTKSIAHNITDLDIVTLIYGIMQVTEGANGRFIPTGNSPGLSFSSSYIFVGSSSDLSSQSAIIVIEYTKAAPAPDVSPAPDSRSLEEETEPEEPINEEPKKEEK